MAAEFTHISRIQAVFTKHSQGLCRDYDKLVNELADPSVTDEILLSHLQGIKGCITDLDQKRETLVGVLLRIELTNRSPQVVKEYQQLLLNLVSAYTFYLKAVLRSIVLKFTPVLLCRRGVDPAVDENSKQTHDQCFLQLHTLLQAIITIVPMSPSVLLPLLAEKYPYMTKPAYVLKCYVRNLLNIALYLPKYRQQILEIIVDNMTKLDVQCSRDKISAALMEDSDDGDDDTGIFDMDGVNSTSDSHKSKLPPEARKLDVLMETVMVYMSETCQSNGELDWELTKKLYLEMLGVFNKILLPTYASNYIQFLMFYICSFKTHLLEGFLDYLWKKVQNPNTESMFRQAAIAYIASLLARAKYITISTLKAMIDLMTAWVHKYIHTADPTSRADMRVHGTFYAACQALFYILVFRHKELLEIRKGEKYCQRLNLQNIVTCRLNPLKFCIATVVDTFSSIARQHQLAFCDTIIERNKRNQLPTTDSITSGVNQAACVNTLYSFFPFDPYLLPQSSLYIHPLYNEYEGRTVLEDSADEQEEDFMEVEGSLSEKIGSTGIDMSVKSPTSPSFIDLMNYSTSPGFKHA